MRKVFEAATEVEAELLDVKFALALGAGIDANFVQRWRINDYVIAFGSVMQNFGGLLTNFWRAYENIAVTDEKPVFAAKRIDFDAGRFGASMVGGEPLVEGEGE